MDEIIDSKMSREEALMQNPRREAPQSIIEKLELLTVQYVGFDGLFHRGQIVAHQEVSSDVQSFFTLALTLCFPIEKVIPIRDHKYHWDDELSCTDNNSSGYNYRTIMGTNRLSLHAEGLAFDINPVQNVYIRYDQDGNEISRTPPHAIYDTSVRGTLTKNHPLVVHMRKLGWVWGGDWTVEDGTVDYQHFDKEI